LLLEISIEHFALIDQVRLSFAGGLNVLTGETGAGKSIILDAVQAVLGGRTGADVVRAGEEKAVVEALFDLSAAPETRAALLQMGIPLDEENLLVVRREIPRTGRGTVRINGRTATTTMLRELTGGLVDIHGQHEHQSLLQVEKHVELLDQYGGSLLQQEGKSVDLLDRFAGGPILALREELAGLVRELHAIRAELEELVGDERDRARREDLLRFQVEELTAANLKPGEEQELEAELQILANADRLKRTAANAYAVLYEGTGRQLAVYDHLSRVKSEVEDLVRLDPSLAESLEMVTSALLQVQEAGRMLGHYADRIEDDPERLHWVEKRLDQINSLKRKYGETVEEMLDYLRQVEADLERLERSQELIEELKAREESIGARVVELAGALTRYRREAARELSARVEVELADLGMPRAKFVVAVEPPQDPSWWQVGPRGWDRVEFLFSPNPGEPPKPLAKVVSGGEMSRIMLALKVILARVDGVPTLVFDEVDTGISGRAAQAVGEKLARIAADRQVLCVTHLPQVAALADQQFLIEKQTEDGRTFTRVYPLDSAGRANELARMIGGAELSAVTLEAAREMLRSAASLKAGLRRA
jgi:DNA repair protein RecN (Recombination protein N)